MVPQRISVNGQRGFTLAELMVVVAVIGILAVVGTPLFLSYLQASQTRGAAQEVATLLHRARQMAIANNTSYRVEVDVAGNRLRFVRTSDNTPWIGPGTDSQGYRRLENEARLMTPTANPTFNPLGTAGGGTIPVQNSPGTSTLSVVVSSSGRIRIQ
jgi:prepilin-type N-terminal cleavage/methylation domain-containing protein